MTRADLTEKILDIKREKGWSWKHIHEQIGVVFGDRLFNTVITKSIRLEESPAYKESIFTFAPKSSGAMEYYSLSEEILSRV